MATFPQPNARYQLISESIQTTNSCNWNPIYISIIIGIVFCNLTVLDAQAIDYSQCQSDATTCQITIYQSTELFKKINTNQSSLVLSSPSQTLPLQTGQSLCDIEGWPVHRGIDA
eukprot:103851_1